MMILASDMEEGISNLFAGASGTDGVDLAGVYAYIIL
jgi:hypothetical protein